MRELPHMQNFPETPARALERAAASQEPEPVITIGELLDILEEDGEEPRTWDEWIAFMLWLVEC